MPALIEHPASRTSVSVSAIAECAFSIAEDYAVDYLRSAEEGGAEAAIRLSLALPPATLQHRVNMRFGLHADILEQGRLHDEVRLQWVSGSHLLPDFRGTLRFRIDGPRTQVLIDGSYRPPLGLFGELFDRFLGRHIAAMSLQDLANRIARYLGDRERSWRCTVPPCS
jgi:hypothetical protein